LYGEDYQNTLCALRCADDISECITDDFHNVYNVFKRGDLKLSVECMKHTDVLRKSNRMPINVPLYVYEVVDNLLDENNCNDISDNVAAACIIVTNRHYKINRWNVWKHNIQQGLGISDYMWVFFDICRSIDHMAEILSIFHKNTYNRDNM